VRWNFFHITFFIVSLLSILGWWVVTFFTDHTFEYVADCPMFIIPLFHLLPCVRGIDEMLVYNSAFLLANLVYRFGGIASFGSTVGRSFYNIWEIHTLASSQDYGGECNDPKQALTEGGGKVGSFHPDVQEIRMLDSMHLYDSSIQGYICVGVMGISCWACFRFWGHEKSKKWRWQPALLAFIFAQTLGVFFEILLVAGVQQYPIQVQGEGTPMHDLFSVYRLQVCQKKPVIHVVVTDTDTTGSITEETNKKLSDLFTRKNGLVAKILSKLISGVDLEVCRPKDETSFCLLVDRLEDEDDDAYGSRRNPIISGTMSASNTIKKYIQWDWMQTLHYFMPESAQLYILVCMLGMFITKVMWKTLSIILLYVWVLTSRRYLLIIFALTALLIGCHYANFTIAIFVTLAILAVVLYSGVLENGKEELVSATSEVSHNVVEASANAGKILQGDLPIWIVFFMSVYWMLELLSACTHRLNDQWAFLGEFMHYHWPFLRPLLRIVFADYGETTTVAKWIIECAKLIQNLIFWDGFPRAVMTFLQLKDPNVDPKDMKNIEYMKYCLTHSLRAFALICMTGLLSFCGCLYFFPLFSEKYLAYTSMAMLCINQLGARSAIEVWQNRAKGKPHRESIQNLRASILLSIAIQLVFNSQTQYRTMWHLPSVSAMITIACLWELIISCDESEEGLQFGLNIAAFWKQSRDFLISFVLPDAVHLAPVTDKRKTQKQVKDLIHELRRNLGIS